MKNINAENDDQLILIVKENRIDDEPLAGSAVQRIYKRCDLFILVYDITDNYNKEDSVTSGLG